MSVHVYVCMLLCLSQAFVCVEGLGHCVHSQSTLSHPGPPSDSPLFTFLWLSSRQCQFQVSHFTMESS